MQRADAAPTKVRKLTLAQVQRDVREHAHTLSELVLDAARRNERDKSRDALEENKEAQRNARFDRIEKRLDTIYDLGKWLLASVGSLVILALVNFALKGGFFT